MPAQSNAFFCTTPSDASSWRQSCTLLLLMSPSEKNFFLASIFEAFPLAVVGNVSLSSRTRNAWAACKPLAKSLEPGAVARLQT